MCLIDYPAQVAVTTTDPPSPELTEIILERDRVRERVQGLIIERDRMRADLVRIKAQVIVKQLQTDNSQLTGAPLPELTTNELLVERIRVRNCVWGLWQQNVV